MNIMMNNLPTLLDVTSLTNDERAFLDHQDFRMHSVGMQFKLEVGRILTETRDWFKTNHKRGFEEWAFKQWGISRQYQQYLMDAFEQLDDQNFGQLGLSLSAQLELKEAPNQQAAIDEVKIRQELEEKITAQKAKEIAEYQRAEKIANDKARSNQERADALDRQIAYVNQRLEKAQKAQQDAEQKAKEIAAQKTKTVEKRVEVVPQAIKTQVNQLQERQKQLTKERDSYRKQLEEERATTYARRAEDREGENAERIRVMFAEATRDYVRNARVFLSRLPSISDTGAFEADDWQRLNEVKETIKHLGRELEKLTSGPTEQQQSFIIDSIVTDTDLIVR